MSNGGTKYIATRVLRMRIWSNKYNTESATACMSRSLVTTALTSGVPFPPLAAFIVLNTWSEYRPPTMLPKKLPTPNDSRTQPVMSAP